MGKGEHQVSIDLLFLYKRQIVKGNIPKTQAISRECLGTGTGTGASPGIGTGDWSWSWLFQVPMIGPGPGPVLVFVPVPVPILFLWLHYRNIHIKKSYKY